MCTDPTHSSGTVLPDLCVCSLNPPDILKAYSTNSVLELRRWELTDTVMKPPNVTQLVAIVNPQDRAQPCGGAHLVHLWTRAETTPSALNVRDRVGR